MHSDMTKHFPPLFWSMHGLRLTPIVHSIIPMCSIQDVMEEWAICQKSWLYLEPIFSSDDIMRQLPVEGKRYQTMDRTWRKIMLSAKQDPKVYTSSYM